MCEDVVVAADCVAVRDASWQNHAPSLRLVRRLVFIEEQSVPEELEWDEADPVAWHVLALTANDEAIGTGRLEISGRIGRIAVLAQHRTRGVGRAIVSHLVNQAADLGFTKVYLHAQTTAVAFYERLGFRAEGPVFDEAGIPHVRMHHEIERDGGKKTGRHGQEVHSLDAR
jgi:predicted GNAT family N-acyltransferase